MPRDIVLDTNILLYATRGHDEAHHVPCARILYTAIHDDDFRIALDNEGEVLDEYKKHLQNKRTGPSQAFQQKIKEEAYGRGGSDVFRFRFLKDVSKTEELEDMGFHSNDLVFVRLAPNTESKTITTTDDRSFLEDEYKEWIEVELDVSVYEPEQCIDIELN